MTSMTQQIVPLTSEWLDDAADLFIAVFNADPWNDRWTLPTAHAMLSDLLNTPGYAGIACLEDGKLIGFAAGHRIRYFNGDSFYLKEMCVTADRQRHGVGSQLMHALEASLRDTGVVTLFLLTMVAGMAESFYSHLGYHRSSRILQMSRRLNTGKGG